MVAGGSLVAQQRKEIKSRLYEIASKMMTHIECMHHRMYYCNCSLAVDLLMCSFRALAVMPGARYTALRKHILQLVMVSGYLLIIG